jgi:hypothetical protein
VDSLFRSDQPLGKTLERVTRRVRLEALLIFAHNIRENNLPIEDQLYLAHLVTQHTNLSASAAEKRVSDAFKEAHMTFVTFEQNAQEAAKHASNAAAYSAVWMFIISLIGALASSLAAVWGGRQREGAMRVR